MAPGKKQSVIWAIGKMDGRGMPLGHRAVPRKVTRIEFGRKAPAHNCKPLVPAHDLAARLAERSESDPSSHTRHAGSPAPAALVPSALVNSNDSSHDVVSVTVRPRRAFEVAPVSDRLLVFSIGPSGAQAPDVLYYVNERPAPELVLTRGLNYTFQVMTGIPSSRTRFGASATSD